MIKWIIRKLGQLGKWSEDAAAAVEQAESNFSAWNIADIGAGFVAGIIFAKLVL